MSVTADLARPVPPELATFLYRCARECAINAAKHAHASRIDITLDSDENGVRLVVRDDGIGEPDPIPRTGGHIGLALLREATADLGGSLRLRAEHGTVVTITLPPV